MALPTAEEIAAILARHPGTILVPLSTNLAPEVLVEWVECQRFRLTPRSDGLHELHIERRASDRKAAPATAKGA